jgi:signal transduction histidine kinase
MRRFLRSARIRLTLTYLGIIMVMQLGFSIAFYRASSQQLTKQLPYTQAIQSEGFRLDVDAFFRRQIELGQKDLLTRLVILNLFALFVGAPISYFLARRTLAPIEEAVEAQSQFVSDASHELRTPLTAIQTTNEVALRKSKLTLKEAKQVIKHNVDDVMRLKELADALLRLANKDNGAPLLGPVQVQEVAAEAMNRMVQAALAKKIKVHDKLPNITVFADKQNLMQVLAILLDNAIKYSPAKSTIILEAETRGKFVFIYVKDQGVGIPAVDLPHVFKRFYRADRSRTKGEHEGYGLGLSIAYKLMQQQRGTIHVTSKPKKGSTFTIKLPRAT